MLSGLLKAAWPTLPWLEAGGSNSTSFRRELKPEAEEVQNQARIEAHILQHLCPPSLSLFASCAPSWSSASRPALLWAP
jgi:hypothetical protein